MADDGDEDLYRMATVQMRCDEVRLKMSADWPREERPLQPGEADADASGLRTVHPRVERGAPLRLWLTVEEEEA